MLTFILFNHNSNIYPTFLKCFSNLNLTRHDLGYKRPTPTDTKLTLSSSVWYKNNPLWDQMFASEYTPSHQWKQITKCDWVLILWQCAGLVCILWNHWVSLFNTIWCMNPPATHKNVDMISSLLSFASFGSPLLRLKQLHRTYQRTILCIINS